MIKIPFGLTQFAADVMPEGSRPGALFLHGGGTATMHRFDALREALLGDGIGSSALDFIGHGETGGDLKSSSLLERTEQAAAAIRVLDLQKPLAIFGSSMGGYTAIKLTEIFDVSRLILFRPGIYRRDVYDVPFGQFTEAIREPESWRKSDAFEILSRFTGKILILRAELDEVIPSEIIDQLYQSASRAQSRQIVTIPQMHHSMSYLSDHPEAFDLVYQSVRDFLI